MHFQSSYAYRLTYAPSRPRFFICLRQSGKGPTQCVCTKELLTRSGDRHDAAPLYWIVHESGSRQFLRDRPAQRGMRAPISWLGQDFKRPRCGVTESDWLGGDAAAHCSSSWLLFRSFNNRHARSGLATFLVTRPVETLPPLNAGCRSVHVHCVTGIENRRSAKHLFVRRNRAIIFPCEYGDVVQTAL
jgi:hypothetical protein